MNKEMIISSTPHETRVAILEDDQVVEIFIEREQSRGVVGNIYKGRVSKVLPGMQSAFVDLGLERDAFLYVSDVISPTEEALEDDEDSPVLAAPVPDEVHDDAHADAHADVDAGETAPASADALTSDTGARGSATRSDARGANAASAAPLNPGARRPRDRERQPPTAKIE